MIKHTFHELVYHCNAYLNNAAVKQFPLRKYSCVKLSMYSNLTITHLEYFYAGLLCAQVVTSHAMSSFTCQKTKASETKKWMLKHDEITNEGFRQV